MSLSLFLPFLFILSCNESKDIGPQTIGYDYYPIAIGQYRIYDVEEITFRVASFDTSFYQLRETIFDSIQSIDQTTYLIKRDVRATSMQEWESDSIWSVTRLNSYLTITENNIPFIKLTFPVTAGNTWDGNSLNSRSTKTYYYELMTQALIDSIDAEDHIRMVIEDIPQNTTGIDQRSEVYARGVGLVEKNYLTQIRCTATSCGEDLGKVIGGRLLKQTLIEIGNE